MNAVRIRRAAILAGAAGALLAGAAPAGAATLSLDGDTLVFQGSAGNDTVYVDESYDPEDRLRIESVDAFTSVPAGCELRQDTMADCDVPAALRVELGGGNDRFGELNDMPFDLPIAVHGGDGDDGLSGMHVGDLGEALYGEAGKDTIDGYGGDDVVSGGAGDDHLTGNGGADQVLGEAGNDLLRGDHQAAPGADLIDGGDGSDKLEDYTEYGTDVHPPADVSLDGVANDGRAGEGDDVRSIERMTAYVNGNFVGSDGAEDWQIWSNVSSGGRSVVRALGGNDTITGGDFEEQIDGGAGDDRLEGGRGHDVLVGGPGRDVVYGDETTSQCNPEYPESCVRYGNDVIDVRDGEADQVDCGPGTDQVTADAADVVSPTCETVDRGGAGGGGDGGGGDGGDGGRPGRPALAVKGRPRLGTVLRKGLPVRLSGAPAGPMKVVVRRGGKVVGRRTVTVPASGSATVNVRLTSKARRRLKRVRKVRLEVSAGGASFAITLKR